jgi:prepilin signal peptidase PulO-like enzyme (type II secretory pathway)
MLALPIVAGLVTGLLINLCADALSLGLRSAEPSPDEGPVRFSFGAPACTACGRQRPLLAWSALLAYLTGRRRCRSCSTPLPWRHLLVEVTTSIVFALIWAPLGADAQAGTVIAKGFACLWAAILVLILVTDLEHRLVPHAIMLPAIALAALAAFLDPAWASPARPLLGGALGLLSGLALYGGGILFARLLGRIRGQSLSEVAFGFGDVTLLTFIGLIVGAPDVLVALVIGIFSGGVFAFLWMLLRGWARKHDTLFTAIPYAPFLILGGAIMLAFGREIMAWYLGGM